MVDAACHLAQTLGPNYPEFPDSCLALQLAGGEDVPQVLADGAHVNIEQLGHQALRQPDRLIPIPRFNAGTIFLCGEDKELGGSRSRR